MARRHRLILAKRYWPIAGNLIAYAGGGIDVRRNENQDIVLDVTPLLGAMLLERLPRGAILHSEIK